MEHVRTDRLILRSLKNSDLDDFLGYRSDPEVAKYQGFEPYSHPEAAQFIESQKDRALLKKGEWTQIAIALASTDTLIGDCAVRLEDDSAEIGVTLSPNFHNKRFASEALGGLINHLNDLGLRSIFAVVDTRNLSANRLMKSLGFIVAKENKDVPFKGSLCSEFQYVLNLNGS